MSKAIALAKWNVMRDNRSVFGAKDASSIQLEIGDGLDAGTTSHIGKFGSGVKDCPAYMSKTRSCASAGCRTCWTEPNRLVNYWTH